MDATVLPFSGNFLSKKWEREEKRERKVTTARQQTARGKHDTFWYHCNKWLLSPYPDYWALAQSCTAGRAGSPEMGVGTASQQIWNDRAQNYGGKNISREEWAAPWQWVSYQLTPRAGGWILTHPPLSFGSQLHTTFFIQCEYQINPILDSPPSPIPLLSSPPSSLWTSSSSSTQ